MYQLREREIAASLQSINVSHGVRRIHKRKHKLVKY